MRTVVELRAGALGFDCNTRLTRLQYGAFRALGLEFSCRYLGDLTSGEIDDANASDVGIIPVAHAHARGWRPRDTPGRVDGEAAVKHAAEAKIPTGQELWADLEGCATDTRAEEVILWSGGVCAPIVQAGYASSVYEGAEQPCSGEELYATAFTGYWQSESEVPPVPRRGYRLVQLFVWPRGECLVKDVWPNAPGIIADVLIDLDVAQSDKRGVRPRMVVER